jgi:hypothetical protein
VTIVLGSEKHLQPSYLCLTFARCLEHTIHLAAGDFVKALNPKLSTWTKNQTADSDEEEADVDWVAEWNLLDVLDDEADQVDEEEVNFEPGDTLGKALALVNQVSYFHLFIARLTGTLRSGRRLKQRLSLLSVVLKRTFWYLSLLSGFGHSGAQFMISLSVCLVVKQYVLLFYVIYW